MNEREIKGISTELLCQNAFIVLGYGVSVPINNDKYDFIADIDGMLIRVQVKSCKVEPQRVFITTQSTHLSSGGAVKNRYSKADIDFFATFYDGQCYLIPVEYQNKSQISLFITEPNTNSQTVLYLKDYELEKQIDRLKGNECVDGLKKRTIQQYDLQNQFVAEYQSYADAARAIGKTPAHIIQCANGERKTAYGYKWKYKIGD